MEESVRVHELFLWERRGELKGGGAISGRRIDICLVKSHRNACRATTSRSGKRGDQERVGKASIGVCSCCLGKAEGQTFFLQGKFANKH